MDWLWMVGTLSQTRVAASRGVDARMRLQKENIMNDIETYSDGNSRTHIVVAGMRHDLPHHSLFRGEAEAALRAAGEPYAIALRSDGSRELDPEVVYAESMRVGWYETDYRVPSPPFISWRTEAAPRDGWVVSTRGPSTAPGRGQAWWYPDVASAGMHAAVFLGRRELAAEISAQIERDGERGGDGYYARRIAAGEHPGAA